MTAPISAAVAVAEARIGDLVRRAALTALARAAADYQPSSYDDAVRVRDAVAAALEAEIVVAGDQGEDATYDALSALRVAVVQDLTERGASLAPFRQVATPTPQPALALAVRLYRDPARAAELVAQADPVHPLFMPTLFTALAS